MEQLQATFDKLLRETSTTFHRYMYNRINWDARGPQIGRAVQQEYLLFIFYDGVMFTNLRFHVKKS